MKIHVTAIIPAGPLRESESARRALIGVTLDVDTEAVEALRESFPALPPKPATTYEATLGAVIGALEELGRIEAAIDWRVIQPIIIRIPHGCAEVIET
ncbi:MAG: hypothetical protein ACEQSB_01290 [Undibacterium sp.]